MGSPACRVFRKETSWLLRSHPKQLLGSLEPAQPLQPLLLAPCTAPSVCPAPRPSVHPGARSCGQARAGPVPLHSPAGVSALTRALPALPAIITRLRSISLFYCLTKCLYTGKSTAFPYTGRYRDLATPVSRAFAVLRPPTSPFDVYTAPSPVVFSIHLPTACQAGQCHRLSP